MTVLWCILWLFLVSWGVVEELLDSLREYHRVGNIDIRISIYWNTEIVFSDFLNIEILKFKPSQFQYYIDILKFKQSQFRIISIYWNSSQANFSIISIYWNSSQANFDFSEIGNALRNLFLSAPMHILVQINLCTVTLNEYALHLTAYSVLRIDFAIICQWLFSNITVNAVHRWQAQSLT